nr:polysaccharide lyase family 1 protein [Treponema sp.]
GKDASSGIKGAAISLSGVSNVVLRNLTIQDAYDPFPHHEVKDDGVTSDGYNAQWDGIGIQGESSYIWIDHCTIQDTLSLSHVYTGATTLEKWQTYDGLLDIKGDGANITVSYCKFKNHDKTSLIGPSDDEGSASTRKITYHHNYFYNCGQRLPMVRNTTMHLYNNLYMYSSGEYSQQYGVGVRAGSVIYSENNYFGSGINYAFKDSETASSSGTLNSSGDSVSSSYGTSALTNSVGSAVFSTAVNAYTYTPDTAATINSSLANLVGPAAVTISE